jgi:ubiquinone/menaquinone biosynthesis C-methylase UbiE
MEGATARWYARNRGSANQLALVRRQAAELTAGLPDGAAILEVAFGPGYLATELARLAGAGRWTVTGVDHSHTFVDLATAHAAAHAAGQGVTPRFRLGDAGALPCGDGEFDLAICQAAFKNFPRPVAALDEMYRVLRPGGLAVIDDMNRRATRADIDAEVAGMGLGRADRLWTRLALTWLRGRAADPAQFQQLAEASRFGGCEIEAAGIGMRVRLRRPMAG